MFVKFRQNFIKISKKNTNFHVFFMKNWMNKLFKLFKMTKLWWLFCWNFEIILPWSELVPILPWSELVPILPWSENIECGIAHPVMIRWIETVDLPQGMHLKKCSWGNYNRFWPENLLNFMLTNMICGQREKTFQHVFQLFVVQVQREEEEHEMCLNNNNSLFLQE